MQHCSKIAKPACLFVACSVAKGHSLGSLTLNMEELGFALTWVQLVLPISLNAEMLDVFLVWDNAARPPLGPASIQ